MIAELPDGTELHFPDDMDDDEVERRSASVLGRLNAGDALLTEMKALRADNRAGVTAIVEAILRPRELVRDAMGKPLRAKPAAPKS